MPDKKVTQRPHALVHPHHFRLLKPWANALDRLASGADRIQLGRVHRGGMSVGGLAWALHDLPIGTSTRFGSESAQPQQSYGRCRRRGNPQRHEVVFMVAIVPVWLKIVSYFEAGLSFADVGQDPRQGIARQTPPELIR